MKSFDSVIHQYPMYSLNNSYSKQDLEDWNQRLIRNLETENINFLCELKFDGVSINLTYENGNLIKAVTRGDGVQGDDVTENIKTIKTIPLKLKGSYPEKFQIRGEIIINKHDFAEMNNKRFEVGIHECTFYLYDIEKQDTVMNEDGSVKEFYSNKIDMGYWTDDIDPNDLKEIE